MESKAITGTIWTAANFGFFIVEKTEKTEDGVWIFYHNKENIDQKYHCLIGAFLQRFTIYENS